MELRGPRMCIWSGALRGPGEGDGDGKKQRQTGGGQPRTRSDTSGKLLEGERAKTRAMERLRKSNRSSSSSSRSSSKQQTTQGKCEMSRMDGWTRRGWHGHRLNSRIQSCHANGSNSNHRQLRRQSSTSHVLYRYPSGTRASGHEGIHGTALGCVGMQSPTFSKPPNARLRGGG